MCFSGARRRSRPCQGQVPACASDRVVCNWSPASSPQAASCALTAFAVRAAGPVRWQCTQEWWTRTWQRTSSRLRVRPLHSALSVAGGWWQIEGVVFSRQACPSPAGAPAGSPGCARSSLACPCVQPQWDTAAWWPAAAGLAQLLPPPALPTLIRAVDAVAPLCLKSPAAGGAAVALAALAPSAQVTPLLRLPALLALTAATHSTGRLLHRSATPNILSCAAFRLVAPTWPTAK